MLSCGRSSQKAGLAGKVWQYFTVVPDLKSVGVRDGKRTDAWPVILRAVNTVDAMTATVEDVPFALLQKITDRITHEVHGRQPSALRPDAQALRGRLSGNDARNGENPHEYRLFCPSILLLILD